jgi:hypothetical protein
MKNLAFATLFLCLLVTAGMNVKIGVHAVKQSFEPMSFDWTDADLRSVFMLNASDGWTVGQGGTILHWNGAAWETVESPTESLLVSIHMVNSTDGWAVGDGGVIIHWDGTAWSEVASPTLDTLYGVYMVNANDGWAVGGMPGGSPSAVIIRWNGTAWSKVTSPTSNWLRSVFMVNSTDGWAVSGAFGTIVRWNGTVWKTVTGPTSSGFNSVFMVNATEGWATCFNGQIIRWDGLTWSNFTKPTSQSLRSVFMLNATEGWIVGDSDILHWNGSAWNNVTKPAANWLFSVFMVEADDGWDVGDFGLILHWNGTEWAISKSPVYLGDLYLSDSDVYVIEGIFNINGSIIVEENATLILKNAVINFTQIASYQYNVTLRNPVNGNPRLQSENSTITSDYWFQVFLYDNSSATFIDSVDTSYLAVYNSATAYVFNSTIRFLVAAGSAVVSVFNSTISYALGAWGGSPVVLVSNSTIEFLPIQAVSVNCTFANIVPGFLTYWNSILNTSMVIAAGGYAPNVTLINTDVNGWQLEFEGSTNASIIGSQLRYLHSYGYSNVWLVNSTANMFQFFVEGKVYVSWYLDVHVIDSMGQNVPSANVTATYSNITVAESKLTDAGGWARLTLMEKLMNTTGSYPIGNYTVTAFYEVHTGYQSVNMTGNQEITIMLPFIVPEFPVFLLLPLFMIATLAVVLIFKRKHTSF